MSMSLCAIKRLLRNYRPHTPAEARKIGIRMRFVGEGCFREAYIVENEYILKFPISRGDAADWEANAQHSRDEMDALRQAKDDSRLKWMRKHLPTVYYFDEETGVILLKRYRRSKWPSKYRFDVDRINMLYTQTTGCSEDDIDISSPYSDNVACTYDSKGRPIVKIVDLGLLVH